MGDERYNELRIAIAEYEAARQKVRAAFERLVADEFMERLLATGTLAKIKDDIEQRRAEDTVQ